MAFVYGLGLYFALAVYFAILSIQVVGQKATDSTWLTNGRDGLHRIAANTQDQCYLQPGQSKNLDNGYAIRFTKHGEYSCDAPDGLLICYESKLDQKSMSKFGLTVAIPNQIYHDAKNPVAKMCKEKFGTPNGIPLNGILVRTEMAGENEKIVVQTSLGNEKIRLDVDEFELMLMNRKFMFTRFREASSGPKDRWLKYPTSINVDFWKLGKAFLENMPRGAKLDPYKGLWMLGLDMMPHFELEQELHLYIFRACNCSMHAFFISPDDTIYPKKPEKLTLGSNTCPARNISVDKKIGKIDVGHALELDGISDAKNPFKMELLIAIEDDDVILNATISGNCVTLSSLEKVMTNCSSNNETALVEKDTIFNVLLALDKHNYHFELNHEKIEIYFWPSLWWIENPMQGHKLEIKLKGNFVLLNQPKIVKHEAEFYNLEIPNVQKIKKEMIAGANITVRAKIPDGSKKFEIILLHDAPEENENIGATVMKVHVDMTAKKISLNSFYSGTEIKPNASDSIKEVSPFEIGKNYEIGIEVQAKNYVLKVNDEVIGQYTHKLPAWAVDYIRIDGDIMLLGKPVVDIPPATEFIDGTKSLSIELPTLLRVGDTIQIKGQLLDNAADTLFEIYLLHEAAEFSEQIGDVPLRLIFGDAHSFGKLIAADAYKKKEWTNKETKSGGPGAGSEFTIEIIAEEAQFVVKLNQGVVMNFKYQLPPWAVDHIWVIGKLKHLEKPKLILAKPNKNIKQLEKALFNEGSIKVNGHVTDKKDGTILRLSLFFEAITHDEIIGKTVLEILLQNNNKKTTATFSSFFNEKNVTSIEGLKPVNEYLDGQFSVEITWQPHNWYLKIVIAGDNDNAFIYREQLPIWAVEYVVVEGGFTLDGEIEVIMKNELQQ